MTDEAPDSRPDSVWSRAKPYVELAISSGLVVAVAGVIYWTGATDARVDAIEKAHDRLQTEIDGLDNVALGTRLNTVEVTMKGVTESNARVEKKVDRMLIELGTANHSRN